MSSWLIDFIRFYTSCESKYEITRETNWTFLNRCVEMSRFTVCIVEDSIFLTMNRTGWTRWDRDLRILSHSLNWCYLTKSAIERDILESQSFLTILLDKGKTVSSYCTSSEQAPSHAPLDMWLTTPGWL